MENKDDKVVKVEGVQGGSGHILVEVEPPKNTLRKPNLPAWVVRPMGGNLKPLAELSDEGLYQRCRECGQNAKEWSRKFAALLPEVAKRGLHRRKGFVSIGEFAGKVAGMSEYAVDRIFQLYAKIKDKPCLLKLFESGAVGWSKIAKVAYVATVETDKLWAEKVPILSMAALEVLVQNYRRKSVLKNTAEGKNLFSQGATAGGDGNPSGGMNGSDASALPGEAHVQDIFGHTFEPPVRFSFPASREVEFDLRLAKQKLEKQTKQVLSWNETFQLIIKNSKLEGALSGVGGVVGGGKGPAGEGKGLAPIGGTVAEELCKKCAKKQGIFKICEECSRKIV